MEDFPVNIILRQFKDQLGGSIFLARTPHKIISLVPSQTELLFDLGLDKEVIGITRYCIHPVEKCAEKIKIGGTKRFDFDLIDKLKPDLIIGNKEENYKAGIERLRSKYAVWMSDVNTLEDAYQMIKSIGDMVDKGREARDIVSEIESKVKRFKPRSSIKVAYFIWQRPYMVAGENTFIDDMLRIFGFANVFGDLDRYPEVTLDQIRDASPAAIFLSSEPFPFKSKHLDEFNERFPSTIIRLVDGTMFSWYGSRLRYAADYFEKLIKDLQILLSV
ncbi:MAG: helical backbone metal receptor [Thermodesulfobacteriota bacterium]